MARREDRFRVRREGFRTFWRETNSDMVGGQRDRTVGEQLPSPLLSPHCRVAELAPSVLRYGKTATAKCLASLICHWLPSFTTVRLFTITRFVCSLGLMVGSLTFLRLN